MASSRGSSTGSKGKGGGRTPTSEPKIQVFKGFTGVDFEHGHFNGSKIVVDQGFIAQKQNSQTDLQMTYVMLQNNALVTDGTIEVRDDLVYYVAPKSGTAFTGPVCLVGSMLYVAASDGNIYYVDIDDDTLQEHISNGRVDQLSNTVELVNNTESDHDWVSFGYFDDKLIGLTEQNEIWVGDVDPSTYEVAEMENALPIDDPTEDLSVNGVQAKGLLSIGAQDSDHPYRISMAFAYKNKFGSTRLSDAYTFYANYPITEWYPPSVDQVGMWLRVRHPTLIDEDDGIESCEFYYTVDDSSTMLFLRDVKVEYSTGGLGTCMFDWYGYYNYDTNDWLIGDLVTSDENYTSGAPASRMTVIDGRMYFWGDKDNPQRLYIGGNPGNLLSISPGTGGGFVDVEPGTGQEIRCVLKYKTQSGNSIVTMLCDAPNTRKEQRYNLVENTVAISNEQSMKSWHAEQVAGAVGCKSFDGAIVCQDGLYSVSRYGLALTTLTMEYNSQIRTNYVSEAIKPVFTDAADTDTRLRNSIILELDGIIYMTFGDMSLPDEPYYHNLDNVVFCYDIDAKAWWTYTIEGYHNKILNMFHMDWQNQREGIGIVESGYIRFLPTTIPDPLPEVRQDGTRVYRNVSSLVRTADISTQMPQQGWQYLSQLEFHFDYIVSRSIDIVVDMVDMFGRVITVTKKIREDEIHYDYVVRMRIDQRVMSYRVMISGSGRYRLTHWLARVYVMSSKVGQIWGFDDGISRLPSAWVQPTFKSYNDVRKAIFT